MDTQPTDNGLWDNISKRADELKRGDHIIDRPGTPLQVTHTQTRASDGLILVVFADGVARAYDPDAPFTMATEEQLAADRNRQAWRQVVDQVHTWLSWIGRNADDLPAPTSVELRMQHSMGWPLEDAEKRAAAARVAALLGVQVEESDRVGGTGAVSAAFEVGDRAGHLAHELRYVVHGFVKPDPVAELKPIVHWRSGIGAACQLTLRLVDRCVDDPDAVDCRGCRTLMPAAEEEPAAPSRRLVEPAPQTDPALADADDDVEPPRSTVNGDPDAVLPPSVEGHGHQRGEDWRDVQADCDDPWHLDTGEVAPTAPCGGCGAVAEVPGGERP